MTEYRAILLVATSPFPLPPTVLVIESSEETTTALYLPESEGGTGLLVVLPVGSLTGLVTVEDLLTTTLQQTDLYRLTIITAG